MGMLWVLATLGAAFVSEISGLHNVKVVFPPVVRMGGEATLLCLYDMEGEPLYSVKWYRGNHEFYRYMPKESPAGRIFPFEGITVDLSASNANQVSLKNIPLHLSGKFRCEVSADAPLFSTKCVEDDLTVLDFPDTRPIMTLMSTSYREGELLSVNCTTQSSKSPPTLTFYINNQVVPPQFVTSWGGGAMLQTRLRQADFSPQRELRLKCVASVKGLYNISSGSAAIWLEEGKPSVLGAKHVKNLRSTVFCCRLQEARVGGNTSLHSAVFEADCCN
ncbi:uncharacterized protein [Periplaneta americana]|uniref:uncharacterized protein isoform X2 n=1 Tax=Periplaneta americana TaxID=6978 RepID=UPI0037E746AC